MTKPIQITHPVTNAMQEPLVPVGQVLPVLCEHEHYYEVPHPTGGTFWPTLWISKSKARIAPWYWRLWL